METKNRNKIAYSLLQTMILESKEKIGPSLGYFRKRIVHLAKKGGISNKDSQNFAEILSNDIIKKVVGEVHKERRRKDNVIRNSEAYSHLKAKALELKKKKGIRLSSAIKRWEDFEKKICALAEKNNASKTLAKDIARVIVQDFIFPPAKNRPV